MEVLQQQRHMRRHVIEEVLEKLVDLLAGDKRQQLRQALIMRAREGGHSGLEVVRGRDTDAVFSATAHIAEQGPLVGAVADGVQRRGKTERRRPMRGVVVAARELLLRMVGVLQTRLGQETQR